MESSDPKQQTHDDDDHDEHLGSDQFMEIFSRMPAKAVIKFSSLSKSLSTLFTNPLFVEKQTSRSSLIDGGLFVQSDSFWYPLNLVDFHVLPGDGGGGTPSTFGIPSESLSFFQQKGDFLASSHGLVLLRQNIEGKEFLITCNPATRRWASLSIPEWLASRRHIDWSGVLFECHPRNLSTTTHPSTPYSEDYTIIVPVWAEEEGLSPWFSSYNLVVYHNGRWEDMCDLRVNRDDKLRRDMPVGLFRGCDGDLVIHYLCDSFDRGEPYVLAYDIKRKELWRTFELPEGAWNEEEDSILSEWKLKMFKWGSDEETLGLARIEEMGIDCMITVWVLEDYERSLWRTVVKKTTMEMGVLEEKENGYVVGCCVVKERRLVFANHKRVYVYEMAGHDAGRLEVVAEHGFYLSHKVKFMLYANTLCPVCGAEASIVVEEKGDKSIEAKRETSKFNGDGAPPRTFLGSTCFSFLKLMQCCGNF